MNILNQASNITQLNANKTSFDPTQVGQLDAAAGAVPVSQPAVPSFLIQPSPSNVSSVMPPQPSAAMQSQIPAQIPSQQQQQQQADVQQPIQQQPTQSATADAAIFQRNAALAKSSSVPASSNGAAAVVGALPPSQPVQIQQQPLQAQHIPQQLQQPVYQEKKEYMYSDKKTLMNGRVPATRRDGRKLFVGGLPNEVTDLSFLQFFQQYGEVIDSVVLLDRRTKRSRGFGFVTFSDPNVAAALLTTIPGRTGVVYIMGKNCEVKASEPKSAETAHLANVSNNYFQPASYHQQPQSLNNGWSGHQQMPQQQMAFGAGGRGKATHQLQVNQTLPIPPNFNHGPGGPDGGGLPIYSHSTITRTTSGSIASPDGASQEGTANIYIQNNFYTLPSGMELPPTWNAMATPEEMQAQQTELVQSGGTMALGQAAMLATGVNPQYTAYSPSALQPSYPGTNGSDMDSTKMGGQPQQQQQHMQTVSQPQYRNGQY